MSLECWLLCIFCSSRRSLFSTVRLVKSAFRKVIWSKVSGWIGSCSGLKLAVDLFFLRPMSLTQRVGGGKEDFFIFLRPHTILFVMLQISFFLYFMILGQIFISKNVE